MTDKTLPTGYRVSPIQCVYILIFSTLFTIRPFKFNGQYGLISWQRGLVIQKILVRVETHVLMHTYVQCVLDLSIV